MREEDETIDDAMDTIVARVGPRLLSLLTRLLGDRDEARDVCQDTWLALWTNGATPRDLTDPWPLVRTTGVRKAIDRLRSRRSRPVAGGAEVPAPSVRDSVLDLDVLGAEERAALVLHYWEGRSVLEIAEMMETAPGTVKSWMHRARARLRDQVLREERS